METRYNPTTEEKEIVINALYEFCIPKVHGMTADEVATKLLTRLHDRNRSVVDASARPRATHPRDTV